MPGITLDYYKITFSQITCLVPSSGVNPQAIQAATQIGLDVLKSVGGTLTPLGLATYQGVAIGVIGLSAVSISQGILLADQEIRKSSMPDQFYISWTESIENPKPAADYNDLTDIVYYPVRGGSPSDGNYTDLVAGASYNCSQPVFVSQQPGAVVFWDYDSVSGDDPLWIFPLNDDNCGSFDMVLFNAVTCSQYHVVWTLEHIKTSM